MFSLIVCFLFATQALAAVDLNIYRSVTEVRQVQSGVGTYQYLFQNGEYSNIIDGSISWDGTPFVRQEIYNTVDTLKGASVTVRQSSVCECKVIEAKIVDPNSMLLENVETGAFFYADSRAIEYTTRRPSDGGTTLSFEFRNKKVKFNGTLSYLMRGITWVPNYDLSLTGDDTCSLAAYAVIRNNQQQEYNVDNTYLYSGDLQLINTYSTSVVRPVALRSAAKAQVDSNESLRSISFDGEEKGFYFYSLKTNYNLRPSSSIRLPFVEVSPKCRFYYKTASSVGSGVYKGVFQRNYDLTPDKFLPAGVVTIRDNKVLVGQSSLPDAPENFTQTLTLGQDNDVRYSIKGNQTAASADKAKSIWRTYDLDVTISNFKNKQVRGQLDLYGAVQTTIDSSTCPSAKVNANLINFPFELNGGDNNNCQLTITLRYS